MPAARPTAVGRGIFVLTGGTVLVALSAVQAEFDFGVPQFQALYLPLLIMVAAGMALVLARIALGPWGAVKVVLVYLGLRGFLALVVGGVLNHTVPRFPLYLASALAVEAAAAWVGTRSRLRFGLVAGCAGRDGRAGRRAGVGAAVGVGAGADAAVDGGEGGCCWGRWRRWPRLCWGRVWDGRSPVRGGGWRRGGDRMPLAALVGAGVALVAVLAYPLPRNVGSVDAVIRTEVVGRPGVRRGRRSTRRTRPTGRPRSR